MTLEDFFTLTEMKNGLATLARVEDLICMMQQQKGSVMSNVGDTARQWSSVASTLATTENKDCLDHFVQLNGLSFLNQWLQEALKCCKDTTDNAVDELINALLGSLERLPIRLEESVASGIRLTVEQLLGHESLNIKERARSLYERWDHAKAEDDTFQDLRKGETGKDNKLKSSADVETVDGMQSVSPVCGISLCREGTEEDSSKVDSPVSDSHYKNVTMCSHISRQVADDGRCSIQDQVMPTTSLNSTDSDGNLGDGNALRSSHASNSCGEKISIREESCVLRAPVMTSTSTCSLNTTKKDDSHSDASVLNDVDSTIEMKMEVDTNEGSPSETGQKEGCKVSLSYGLSAPAPAPVSACKPERAVSCNFDSKGDTSCVLKTTEHLPRSASVDCVVPKYMRNMELRSIMHDLLTNECKLRKMDAQESFVHGKDGRSASEVKGLSSESQLKVNNGEDIVIPHDSSKSGEMSFSCKMDRSSELGLEDGEIDALEVARQVAIEVEREVVDYREPFCSSSPDVNSGEVMGAQNSEIVQDELDQPGNRVLIGNESLPAENISDASSSLKADNMRILETGIHGKCEDVEMSNSTTDAHESGGRTDRDRCDFDLNEDICTEEFDCFLNPVSNNPANVSAPIVVVATSKGAPLLPVTPLRFEGEVGWKGSAATSAFRPASPRRTLDAEKAHSGSKRKADFIEFDLNVAESGDDAIIDPTSVKAIPASSDFPSRDSSMEISSRITDRLKLDLNRLGDEDASTYPSSNWRFPHQNGDQTLSSASSSSSRQPSLRDFDLNDSPSLFDPVGSQNHNKSSSKDIEMCGGSDPITCRMMGPRMAAEREDYISQAQQSFLGSRPSVELTALTARPMLSYGHISPSPYGYSGLTAGPAMPFTPSFYGPGSIPYMVDSRGATVVPQILGPMGLGAPSATPPFLMSVANPPSNLNGVGPSQSGLDLNSGMMSMESGNREGGSLKHLFMQGHNGFVQQMRAEPHNAAVGVPLKLKESDPGRESYAVGYKQMTSRQ